MPQHSDLRIDLCEAIILNDLVKVRHLLVEAGVSPDFTLPGLYRERTPLMTRIWQRKASGIESCLNEYNQFNDACSPITLAVTHNRLDVVRLLVERGADVNVVDWDSKCTPLCHALLPSVDAEILRTLIAANAQVNGFANCRGHRILLCGIMAAASDADVFDDFVRLEMLLEAGADARAKDFYGHTALHFIDVIHRQLCDATMSDDDEEIHACDRFISLMFRYGATSCVNELDRNLRTPLHMAVRVGCSNSAMLMVKHGADPSVKDMDSSTALGYLHPGFPVKSFETIAKLLTNSTDEHLMQLSLQSVISPVGENLFFAADKHSILSNLHYLASNGVDINHRNMGGRTLLSDCIKLHGRYIIGDKCKRELDLIRTLIDIGADVNLGCNDGFTPIHFAVSSGSTAVVELLMMNNVRLDPVTKRGETVLHFAARHTPVLELLFTSNSDDIIGKLNVRDAWGSTVLHWAVCFDNHSAIRFLLKAGADRNVENCDQLTPAELAKTHWWGHLSKIFESEIEETGRPCMDPRCCTNCMNWMEPCKELAEMVCFDDLAWHTHIKTKHEHEVKALTRYLLGSDPSAGGLFYNGKENVDIIDEIMKLMRTCMMHVADVEPLFEAEVSVRGSIRELTKCGRPDELDILISLTKFRHAFIPSEDASSNTPDGFMVLRPRDEMLAVQFSKFLIGGVLDGALLTDNLYVLLEREIWQYVFCSDLRSKNLLLQMPVKYDRFSITQIEFQWTGPVYKQLKIDVDVVPAIELKNPPVCFHTNPWLQSMLLTEASLPPLYTVIRTLAHEDYFPGRMTSFRLSSDEWEALVLDRCESHVHKTYILLKTLLNNLPFCAQATSDKINQLLLAMEDESDSGQDACSENQGEQFQNVEDENVDTGIDDACTSTPDEVEGGSIISPSDGEASCRSQTVSTSMTIYNCKQQIYQRNCDNSAPILAVATSNDTTPQCPTSPSCRLEPTLPRFSIMVKSADGQGRLVGLDSLAEIDLTQVVYCDEEEEDEVEGSAADYEQESSAKRGQITSYMIKTALLHTLTEESGEKDLNKSDAFRRTMPDTEASLDNSTNHKESEELREAVVALSRRVCERLERAIDAKSLPSYFIPSVDVLRDEFKQPVYNYGLFKRRLQRLRTILNIISPQT